MRVVIIGAGTMGHGIAVLCLRAGHVVDLADVDPRALDETAGRLRRLSTPGRVRDARIRLGDLRSAQVVIDATPQDVVAKRELLSACLAQVTPACLVGTVTLGVPLRRLDHSPDARVLGMHFMNPPHRLKFCEIVARPHTPTESVRRAEAFVDELGLQRTTVADTPGFVLNRVLLPFLFDAVRALEAGVGTVEDIDRTFTAGCGHPMGPLAVLDLVGLEVASQLAADLRADFPDEPRLQTPELLTSLLAAGRGFHSLG